MDNVTSSAPQGPHGPGSTIVLTVNFNETVVHSGARPLLLVSTGGTADYSSGSGTSSLDFTYAVRAGDAAGILDYAGPDALSTRGALAGAAGNSANLALPGPGDSGSLVAPRGIAIAGTGAAAYAVSAASPDADGPYGAGTPVNITVSFSGAVDVEGGPRLLLAVSPPGHAGYAGGSGTADLEFVYMVRPGDAPAGLEYANASSLVLPAGASIRASSDQTDAVLVLPVPTLGGSLGNTTDIAIDGVPPRLLGASSPGPAGTYGTGRTVAITAVFSEPVTVEGAPAALALSTIPPRSAAYAGIGAAGFPEFLYTVQPGDLAGDLDYAAAAVRPFEGALVRDMAGNLAAAGNLSLPGPGEEDSLSDSKSIKVHGAVLPVLAAAGSASDGQGTPGIPGTPTFDGLGGARGVAAFELGSNGTFAVVASHGDDAVQLVQILDDGTLRAVSTLNDTAASNLELNGAMSVDTIDMGGDNGTFAVVASFDDDGVQLVRIHENGTMEAAHQIDDGGGGALALVGARSVDAFWTSGGRAYALVASAGDHGVQVIRIGGGGTMSTPFRLYLPGLNGASDVSAYRAADGTTQALVPAYLFDGIMHVRLNEVAGSLSAIGAGYTVLGGNFQALGRAGFATVLDAPGDGEGGGEGADSRLAMVTPHDRFSRVVMLRIYDNGNMDAPGYVTDGQNGLERLGQPRASDSFTMGGRTYAVVASQGDNAVQMILVHADGALEAAGSAVDGQGGPNGFAELAGAHGIDVFEMGGRTYAIVASEYDSGVQLMRLSPPSVASVTTSLPSGTRGIGLPFNVTVEFDAPVAALGPAPSLLLAFDGGIRAAEYLDGNRTNRLVFSHALEDGDSTGRLDYAGPAALTTRGIIVDARGAEGAAAADLELPAPGEPGSLGSTSAVRIL